LVCVINAALAGKKRQKAKKKKSQKSEIRGAEFPGSWLLALDSSLFNFYFLLPQPAQRDVLVYRARKTQSMDRDYNTLAGCWVAYCVIDPPAVKSAADLGDRVKVFCQMLRL